MYKVQAINTEEKIFDYLPVNLKEALMQMPAAMKGRLEEIRMKANGPVIVNCGEVFFLTPDGKAEKSSAGALRLTMECLRRSLDRMCQNSIYASQNELKNGFITLPGGHRAGVCGKAVVGREGISALSDISSINLRIAHEIRGAADGVMDYITEGGISNTLVISPPGCGKTTLLRDIARQLAGEKYLYRVGIVDERSELAAMYRGVPQNDVGDLSDVYDACPKAEGIMMLLRAMAPDVIITDEIGALPDAGAIYSLINAGVKIICSAHGYDRDDLMRREGISSLIRDGVFGRIIVLSRRNGAGTIEKLY